MPIIGWLAAGVFQGAFTFFMAWEGMTGQGFGMFSVPLLYLAALLSTVMLLGSYPMTQVYQHEEDGRRCYETISRKLGVLGTFFFTAAMFTLASAGFASYYQYYYSLQYALLFFVVLSPVLGYFFNWFVLVYRDARKANFKRTMRLYRITSICLSAFFVLFWVLQQWGIRLL